MQSPLIGEHSTAVLAEAGYTPDQMRSLVANGVVIVAQEPGLM